MELDDWQREVLATDGNIVLRSGRQVGKSTVISIKAAEFAIKNPGKVVMVVASVERQALLLFEKIMGYLFDHYKGEIRRGKYKPTKHKVMLKNGSVIHCLPTGLSGYGIRGYTIDLLIVDEAAFVEDAVFTAITPALAITRGNIILLSTPFGKKGYFFRAFSDPTFTSFHISSEACPRRDDDFLAFEKERMTVLQYAQEYLGEFVDELRQFFPTELIQSCMTLGKGVSCEDLPPSIITSPPPSSSSFLGVDVARMGGDETVLFSLRLHEGSLYELDIDITKMTLLTETVDLILSKDRKYGYKNIYIDDGGLGVGVFDPLLVHPQTRRKVIPINNSSRSLDRENKRKKKLLKEDLYNNLLNLMERGKLKLRYRDEVLRSLKSIQVEYTHRGMRIFGSYSHIAEALIRSAWCVKSKSLNIYIY
jgi:hypothetical protein